MIVSHNIQAMNAIRLANVNVTAYSDSTEKVSSGYKINRGNDYPAGLCISETMRRQVRGLNQGIQNTKDGINLCQIADGALDEVTNMLQRINELSIHAATGTLDKTDRHYIQAEIDQILKEIDRIGDTTSFNELPIFRGKDDILYNADGSSFIESQIPFSDFTIADMNLGANPFLNNLSANTLSLQAIVNNTNSVANGRTYNLIFGNGSTSNSSFRISYMNEEGNTVQETVSFSSLTPGSYTTGNDNNGNPQWTRNFEYENASGVKITITQQVTASIPADLNQEKAYNIAYSFTNNSDNNANVSLDFMFHADTAYNDNDLCEGYYVDDGNGNGSRLDKFCMYTDGSQWSSSLIGGATTNYISNGIPNSFSIINADEALAFSERISFVSGSEPNSLSIGQYSYIYDWDYYTNLDARLGGNAIGADLGFSLFWNKDINAGDSFDVSFNYGIVAADQDDNLKNIPLNNSGATVTNHYSKSPLWIQSGYEKGSGIWLEIGEMNTEVLGLKGINVTTTAGADLAIEQVKNALHNILERRSTIGAQQNRLEHTVINEENISEQVDASDSRLRDTDVSSEMIRFSNLNILLKVGQEMISQANQNITKLLNII